MVESKKKPKTVMVFARVTAEVRKLYQAAADRDRRVLSDWVRITLDDAAKASERKAKRSKA